MVVELNEETFKENVDSGEPIVIDFWASWCMPCKMLAPIFEEVSKEFEGKLKFAKISTEDHPNIAQAANITGIPCLIVFKDGKEVDRIIGMNQADVLKQKLEEILSR